MAMLEVEPSTISQSQGAVGPIAWSICPLASLEEARQRWMETETLSFFTSWSWIGTWLQCLPDKFTPLLMRASMAGRSNAFSIGISHQSRRRKVIASNALHLNATGDPDFDCITIEHNGFSAPKHLQSSLFESLLDWFARQQTNIDELYLSGVTWPLRTSESGPVPSLGRAMRKSFAVDLLQLGKTNGDLALLLSRNTREQLRRAI